MSDYNQNIEITGGVAKLFIEKEKFTNEYSDVFLKSN